MKDKGFSLIELLATIVIIAFIAIISTPIIINSIETANKGAFTDSIYGIIHAVEINSAEYQYARTNFDVTNGDLTYVLENIHYKGRVNASGLIAINPEGKTSLVLGNNFWCAKKTYSKENVTITNGSCDTITVLPVDQPLITLNGNATMTIEAGTTYTDALATFTDNLDVTRQIVGVGTVNNTTPGVYVITYNAVDSDNFAANQVSRTITVVDTTKPVITINGQALINIDVGTAYTDGKATFTDNSDATRQITGTGIVNINTPGSYSITYNATDTSGNAANQVVRTVIVNAIVSTFVVNAPVMTANMIPITRDGANTKWVKANPATDWYDYDAKKWANAVVTTPTSRVAYQTAAAGTEVLNADVLLYLVWIPRYKFAVPDGAAGVPRQIDVVFEEGTATTGTGTGTGTSFLTHGAFTFNGQPLKGIWTGKFETGKKQAGAENTWTKIGGQGGSALNSVVIKPFIQPWTNNNVSIFYTIAKGVETGSDYGFDNAVSNTHMASNYEWGAISFMSGSKYGKCTAGTCTEIWNNPVLDFRTGCAGDNVSSAAINTCVNTYETANGMQASTTGNIYGIYDMSGGAYEFSFAHWTNYAASSGFTTAFLGGAEALKYINKYTTGTVLIGDAGIGNPTKSWYGDDGAAFVMNSINAFFRLGAAWDQPVLSGVYAYNSSNGAAKIYATFRFVLTEQY